VGKPHRLSQLPQFFRQIGGVICDNVEGKRETIVQSVGVS